MLMFILASACNCYRYLLTTSTSLHSHHHFLGQALIMLTALVNYTNPLWSKLIISRDPILTDHIEWNNATRQVFDILVFCVDNLRQFLAVKQLLFDPQWHVLHEYRVLDHISADNLCYDWTPEKHKGKTNDPSGNVAVLSNFFNDLGYTGLHLSWFKGHSWDTTYWC